MVRALCRVSDVAGLRLGGLDLSVVPHRRVVSLARYGMAAKATALRHSALTHLAEDNVQPPLLMAKSRHRSLRTLQRDARPGPDAVAALTASHDPACRR